MDIQSEKEKFKDFKKNRLVIFLSSPKHGVSPITSWGKKKKQNMANCRIKGHYDKVSYMKIKTDY